MRELRKFSLEFWTLIKGFEARVFGNFKAEAYKSNSSRLIWQANYWFRMLSSSKRSRVSAFK